MKPWAAIQLFLVGAFAGAIASFFPRLVALLGGDPTRDVKLDLFTSNYLIVGAIVAAVVGFVIVIFESDPNRKARDVFMTALGIPTLLMGALSANETGGNVEQLSSRLTAASIALQTATGIPERPARLQEQQAAAPSNGWSPGDLVISRAFAQGATASSKQNSLGIGARETKYYVVFDAAPTRGALEVTQQTLLKRGTDSEIVRDANGGWLLVPKANTPRPRFEAVQEAVRVKEQGAKPFITPVVR